MGVLLKIGTEGDIGDVIYLFGIAAELEGGPHSIHVQVSNVTKLRTQGIVRHFVSLLAPLAEKQPYLSRFCAHNPVEKLDWESGKFRDKGLHMHDRTLFDTHVECLNACVGMRFSMSGQTAWLKGVEPDATMGGRIAINRTIRYTNPYFPWQAIVNHYGDRLVFVGTPDEHARFVDAFGPVDYRRTANMLEVAQIIAGSDLFIGNQSCCNALAEGLKHNLIQETSGSLPDCVWCRSNAQYVATGGCTLPDISGSGELVMPEVQQPSNVLNLGIVPPGGWYYDGKKIAGGIHGAVNFMRMNYGMDDDAAKTALVEYNSERVPEWFNRRRTRIFGTYALAVENARKKALQQVNS